MTTTRKELFWRIGHSWWILLPFTFYFNWIAFLYIGMKVKNKRWALYGAIYAVPFPLIIIIGMFDIKPTSILQYIWAAYLIIGGIISMVHVFKIRKEFLTRLEARQLAKKYLDETLIQQIESEYGLGTDPKTDKCVPTTVFTRGPLTRQS